MQTKITKKQQQIIDFIEKFSLDYGYSPTYREIMSGLNYSSVATVAKHIDNLVILGVLRKSDSSEARSVEIIKNNTSDMSNILVVIQQKSKFLHRIGKHNEALILEKAADILGDL